MRDGKIVAGVDPAAGGESIVLGLYSGGNFNVSYTSPWEKLSEAEQHLAKIGLEDAATCAASRWHTDNCPAFGEKTIEEWKAEL